MIELKVENYCQECLSFEPAADISKCSAKDIYNAKLEEPIKIPASVKTIVTCKNAKRCAGIARHIRSEIMRERNDDMLNEEKLKIENESETIKND